MIVGLDQKMLQTFNQDGSNGQPYANHLPGRTELYLVTPNGHGTSETPINELAVTQSSLSKSASIRCLVSSRSRLDEAEQL
jgi:hypothetical protein